MKGEAKGEREISSGRSGIPLVEVIYGRLIRGYMLVKDTFGHRFGR